MEAPLNAMAPQSFWDWFCSIYPPDEFLFNWQHYFVQLASAPSAANNSAQLAIQVPLFVFEFRSKTWVSGTGAAPTFPVFTGISLLSGNDWTYGQWAESLITGAGGQTPSPFRFPWPREVPPSTNLTVTVNNSLNNVAMTGHYGVVGIEPRRRDESVSRQMGFRRT